MKRVLALLLIVLFLVGCGSGGTELDRALAIRDKLLGSNGCSFDALITADYGEKTYTFEMKCQTDNVGNLSFEVIQPETISGISGTVSEEGGALTFDDKILVFEMLADGQITPVSAPWLMIHTLRGGYLHSCGEDNGGLHMQIDDSYSDNALQLDIWTDREDSLVRGEILWQGKRIVSIDVKNFTIV